MGYTANKLVMGVVVMKDFPPLDTIDHNVVEKNPVTPSLDCLGMRQMSILFAAKPNNSIYLQYQCHDFSINDVLFRRQS